MCAAGRDQCPLSLKKCLSQTFRYRIRRGDQRRVRRRRIAARHAAHRVTEQPCNRQLAITEAGRCAGEPMPQSVDTDPLDTRTIGNARPCFREANEVTAPARSRICKVGRIRGLGDDFRQDGERRLA